MQHVISYLHEDLSLPIYNKTAELSFEDVFCILTSNVKSQMICIRTPFDVKETSSFIVDLTKLDNIKDVTGNDGEKMEHHGQPLRQIVLKDDKITVRKRFSKIDSLSQEADEIFYMYLYLSKTICKKFKRKIFYVYKDQEKKLPHRYAFINFEIDSDYVRSSAPHGNAKTLKKMYRQTCQSTIVKLREATVGMKPKAASEHVRKTLSSAANAPEIPKNYNQAAYARRSHTPKVFQSVSSCTDALTNAIYKCKKPGDNFVKEVRSAPEAVAVFGTDTQFNDVMRFCAAPMQSQASILCVDLTFNLGDFYVTTTSYKNPMLLNKQGKHPIHIGPMQLQHRKLKQSYQYFGSALKRFNPKISELKIYGTDNEKNLTDAFAVEFPIATNLQCFRHFKKCIERRLSGWSFKEKSQVYYLTFKHFMIQATFVKGMKTVQISQISKCSN